MKPVLLVLILLTTNAFAASRYKHKHEDLLMEDEVQFGFKSGFTMTRYTPVDIPDSQGVKRKVAVETGIGATAGLALKLIYAIPQIELDLMWNWRPWPTPGDSAQILSTPVLLKFPWEFIPYLEVFGGAGYQADFALAAPKPHRTLYSGLVASAGFCFEFTRWMFELEGRYVHGLNAASDAFDGGKSREIQVLFGGLWHF